MPRRDAARLGARGADRAPTVAAPLHVGARLGPELPPRARRAPCPLAGALAHGGSLSVLWLRALELGFDATVALFLLGAGVPASAEHHRRVHGGGPRSGPYHSQQHTRRCTYTTAQGGPPL
jgi:hypothetical protein